MIRTATVQDIPRMVEMGERFRHDSTYGTRFAKNPKQMAVLAEKLIAKDSALLAERDGKVIGMLGYIVYEHFVSGETFAGEVFWWVEPEFAGDGPRLMREAEKRAKQAGAVEMQMIAPTEKVAKFYERCNYAFVESTYQKTL
jgi:GNAT superfamily N-acetyltransferase